MSTDTATDDCPDWAIQGRKVEPEWRKRRQAKRARRFVMIGWSELVAALSLLNTNRATKLFLVLHLRQRLQRTQTEDGWVKLVRHELEALGLANNNLSKPVMQLEAAGLVEVQRRPGKRPLLRLVPQKGSDE
jgi:hypothetical protein